MRTPLRRLWEHMRRLLTPPAAQRIAKDKVESANLRGVMEAVQDYIASELTAVDRELQLLREMRDARH